MEETVVCVRAAYKQFGSVPVLRDLNMTVNKASVYSLLGPSGCGKSTLLSCILGVERLNSGRISLVSDRPKDIGYMPQDVAIHEELTIRETFNFYGMVYGMNKHEVTHRINTFVEIFQLPNINRCLVTLSGGQQRRVSLAVSLFHDPPLIILDEPTVGLDPILQHSVWEHLVELSKKEGKTIIITTHYIEEARKSDRVGLMRGGALLREEHPQVLMDSMNCATMEEAFLKLCYSQNEASALTRTPSTRSQMPNFSLVNSPVKYDEQFRFRRFRSQLLSNYYKVKRTAWTILFVFILPSFMAYMVGVLFSRVQMNFKFGFHTEEPVGRSCSNPGLSNQSLLFSCAFLDTIRRSMNIIHYDDLQSGIRDVDAYNITGIYHFGANFTEAMVNRLNLGNRVEQSDVDSSSIDVYTVKQLDRPQKGFFEVYTYDAYEKSLIELSKDRDIPGRLAVPFKVTHFFHDASFFSANARTAGFANGFGFFLAMLFTSTMLFEEVTSGVAARNKVAGLTYLERLLAHLVLQSLVLTVQTCVIFFIMYYVFEFLMNGNILVFWIVLFTNSLVAVAVGVLWTQLAPSYMILSYASLTSAIGLFFLTGTIWPESGQWWLLKKISWMAPTALGVESMRAVASRGLTFLHRPVYTGLISNLVWILALAILNFLVTRIKMAR